MPITAPSPGDKTVGKSDRVPVFQALTSSRRRETANEQRNKKMRRRQCSVGKKDRRAETVDMGQDSLRWVVEDGFWGRHCAQMPSAPTMWFCGGPPTLLSFSGFTHTAFPRSF